MKLILLAALLSFSSYAHASDTTSSSAVGVQCILGGNPVTFPGDLRLGKRVIVQWQESEQDVQKLMFSENGLNYHVKFSSGRTWTGPIDNWESSCKYVMEFTTSIERDGVTIASSYVHPGWMGTFTLNPPSPYAGMACITVGGAKRFWAKKPSCKTAQ